MADKPRRIEIKPGGWYFGIPCSKCGNMLILFDNPHKASITFEGPGILKVRCPDPNCAHEGSYQTNQIVELKARESD